VGGLLDLNFTVRGGQPAAQPSFRWKCKLKWTSEELLTRSVFESNDVALVETESETERFQEFVDARIFFDKDRLNLARVPS